MSKSNAESNRLIAELEDFLGKLNQYQNVSYGILRNGPTSESLQAFYELREELENLYGSIHSLIKKYGNEKRLDDFVFALSEPEPTKKSFRDVEYVVTVVRMAIRDIGSPPQDSAKVQDTPAASITPKAFIAHGKESVALDKLSRFVFELGIEPVVVKKKPSRGKALDDKVEFYMEETDCAIILATGDDEIEGKLHPRQNVIHEIGLAQKTFPDRIIYLLEKGAEFPSNIEPKVWESFTQESMDEAFIAIARELKAFGLIKATKESK
ncbi:MAG: nucleotide-binding protein [Chloroflexi bacterium]|nr:nucleotide-binding protein [Chloroflexota bacterium]